MRTQGQTPVGLDPEQVKWVGIRMGLLAAAFLPAFGALVWKAVKLQVIDGPRMVALAQEQYQAEASIPPRRGNILDRTGTALAATVDVDSVSVDPAALPPEAPAQFARVLSLSRSEIDRRLAKGRRFAWLGRGITPAEKVGLEALKLPSMTFVKEPRRFYPQRELAAQVLGVAGQEGDGLEGLELSLDGQLKGHARSIDVIRDARRRAVFSEGVVDSEELTGATVTLTIDRNMQRIAEQALAKVEAKTQAAGAIAVVMEPKTGEVLALASVPTYNPNDPRPADRAAMRNRAVTDAFEPGSTFKAFVMAGALEDKLIKPEDSVFCENGAWAIGKHTIHDHEGYGAISATKVLQVSSNIGAAKVGEKLGRERLVELYKRFGFGERTGFGLPGEVKGVIPFPRADIQVATESFGQGLTVNAMQLVAGYGALANGGTLMKPYLVKRVVDPDGTVLLSREPEAVRRVVSPEAARQVVQMLTTVVAKEGTAPRAAMADYQVAGKTGTAQKVDPNGRGYSADRRTASFIGMVPAEDPKLVIAVIIDEPRGDKYGGLVAAPAFKEIAEQALPLLGVMPSQRQPLAVREEPEPVKPVVAAKGAKGSKAGAQVATSGAAEGFIDGEGLSAETEGAAGTGEAVVPDVTGLGARAAVRALAQADLEPALEGSGRTLSQQPRAGTVVPRGTRVEVRLGSAL